MEKHISHNLLLVTSVNGRYWTSAASPNSLLREADMVTTIFTNKMIFCSDCKEVIVLEKNG